MAVSVLANNQSHADFFRRRILINAQYWHAYVSDKATDISALDSERELVIKAIAFALDIREAWPSVYGLLVTYASYMERRGHWETWQQLLNRAVKIAQKIEDITAVITLSALLARLLQRQSQLKQASGYYHQVIRLARHSKNLYEEARACTNLGYLYVEDGHWYRAEALCCHALIMFEAINSDHGRAHTENHLGLLYTRQYLWDKAQHYLERACALWQATEDHHGLMRGFINLGMLYDHMRHPREALFFLEKALQEAQLTGEEVEIGKIYKNMSVAYQQNGESVQAEKYAWQAEVIFRRFSNTLDLALTWINLGLIYIDQQKWKEAREYLEAALESCRNLKNEHGQIEALIGLIEYELAQGNKQKATTKLNELERLIQLYNGRTQPHHLQSLLLKYRHSVSIGATKTSEESKTFDNLENRSKN
jgi:tetratricopeptide (TPR) repeat protein